MDTAENLINESIRTMAPVSSRTEDCLDSDLYFLCDGWDESDASAYVTYRGARDGKPWTVRLIPA